MVRTFPVREYNAGRSLMGAFLIALVVFVIYIPVLGGGFLWDDDTHVTANLITRPNGLYRSWFTTEQSNYWPVTWTAFWAQWQLWGMHPTGYRIVTVLLHALCAIAAWRVLRALRIPGAWTAALIFAVHPVNVCTAAWITQQKTLLSHSLALGSMLLLLRAVDSKSRLLYTAALVTFALSLLSKTASAMMPVVMFGGLWWRRRRFDIRDVLLTLPFLLLGAAQSVTEIWFQYHRAMSETVRTDSFWSRLALSGHAIVFYLSKLFAPRDLCFVYPRKAVDPSSAAAYVPLAGVVLILVAALWKRNSWGRPLLLGFGAFCVILFPVLGFVNIYFMRYSWVSDHWQYAASLGPIALVVGSLAHLAKSLTAGAQRALGFLAAAAVVIFGIQSFDRARIFRHNEALWRDTLSKNPVSWMAHNNMGRALIGTGDIDTAVTHLERTLELKPDSLNARLNLADARLAQGQPKEAARLLNEATGMAPRRADIRYEMGRVALSEGGPSQAEPFFRQALDIDPTLANAWIGLGLVAYRRGEVTQALTHIRRSLDVAPGNTAAYHTMGDILFAEGRMEAAREAYQTAAELNPREPDIHNDLGVVLAGGGDLDGAIRCFRKALRINPDDRNARRNLDKALQERGDLSRPGMERTTSGNRGAGT